jgi:hypothetical protein
MSRAVRPLFTLLLALGLLSSPRAEAQDPPLCTFAKRVLSERPAEFTKLKGAPSPNDRHGTTFTGTAVPDGSTKCNLHVRRKIGPQVLAPLYDCTKFNLGIEEAKALYVRYMGELRSCLSGATVSESFPKATDATLTWKWKAQTVEYSAELEVSNGTYLMLNLLAGKPATDHLKMAVSLKISDLSPPRPGATIPVIP